MSRITPLKKWGTFASALTLTAALASCGGDNGDSNADGGDAGDNGDLPTVTLDGVLQSPMAVPIMMVAEEGIDEEHGFILEWEEGDPDGGDTRFLRGDYDIYSSDDSVDAALSNLEGHDTVWWYPMMTNYGSIIVSGDSGYEDVEDLIGEGVGHFGDSSGTTLSMALSLDHGYGIDVYEDFNLMESPAATLPELMAQGEFDAMFNFEPHADRAVQETDGDYLFQAAHYWQDEADGWNPSLTGLWSHREWLEENPDLAQSVQDAFAEAMDRIVEADYAQFAESPYTEQINLNDDEEVERLIDYCIDLPCFVNEWDEDSVESELEWLEMFVELDVIPEMPDNAPVATLDQVIDGE
ncbi:ABC transporter substrate-binding protein [Nesterenkonia populi]